MLLMLSCDLPARAIVLCQKQFNGEYGCCYCEDSGRPREKMAQVRDWPFTDNLVLRTKTSWVQNAQDCLDKSKPVSCQFNVHSN